jgi:cation diffusion facilitator CzcD-associated flavoprotein CzcO
VAGHGNNSSQLSKNYFQHVDEKLQINKDTRFRTRVEATEYNIESSERVVGTSAGFVGRARFLLPYLGYASTPNIPDIPGLRSGTFKGHCFHSTA